MGLKMSIFRKSEDTKPSAPSYNSDLYKLDQHHEAKLDSKGLIPVILQDAETQEVLRLAYMDRWALNITLEEGIVFVYRRHSRRLEKLGEKKNLVYKVQSVKLEKSKKVLLMKVLPEGSGKAKSSFIHEIELFEGSDFFDEDDQKTPDC
ncbi:MAG: hypothetical protein D6748_04190 [Calditrichaeota bacterium]|nr:MAG: hypothetical protein D6748_04190 [Calditrichota bacterium]